jgi:CHAD domain-containing protein
VVEREVKLAVWPGFVLPPLDDVAEGVLAVPVGEKRQEAVYFDAPDVRLARSGITLRHRSDDGWTLKVPDDAPVLEGGLSRSELTIAGELKGVPAELRAKVASRLRTAQLGPVARLQTLRRRTDLVDAEGAVLAEVVDDEVSVLDGRRVALRFREVEVELRDGASPAMLAEVVDRLRAAGAGAPDPTPKVMRALGPRAQAAPDLHERPLRPKPTAAQVLAAGMGKAARRLVEQDPIVREGSDDEGVHQARVATRRLRSDLRTYGELLDDAWSAPLRAELKWLADALGEVRDADVLHARLDRQLATLRRPDRVVGAGILEVLAGQRAEARANLLRTLDSERYLRLLDLVVDGAASPRTLPAADRPAVDVLPRLVRTPWASLEKAANRLRPGSADEELHEVRIRAKRARYAADVAALVIGKPARRLADEVAALQEVLGEHQDACVARDWLRRAAVDVDAPAAFVAGELAAKQDQEADALRSAWPPAWRRASKGKLRAWLKA